MAFSYQAHYGEGYEGETISIQYSPGWWPWEITVFDGTGSLSHDSNSHITPPIAEPSPSHLLGWEEWGAGSLF